MRGPSGIPSTLRILAFSPPQDRCLNKTVDREWSFTPHIDRALAYYFHRRSDYWTISFADPLLLIKSFRTSPTYLISRLSFRMKYIHNVNDITLTLTLQYLKFRGVQDLS